MRKGKLRVGEHQGDLQGLLDRLLGMEPDDAVVDVDVVGELPADL